MSPGGVRDAPIRKVERTDKPLDAADRGPGAMF
jgi:hypothetical protein